jgi:hypothetical protein
VSNITPQDLLKIETTIKKAFADSKLKSVDKSYLDLLSKVVDVLHELRLTVEFDHEERLRAIEDYLQEK